MSDKGWFWDMIEGKIERPPALDLLGYEFLDMDKEKGTARGQFQVKDALLNVTGHIQGGFLASMLDTTLSSALAIGLGPGEFLSTLELKVSFFRTAEKGTLTGEGRVIKRGKSIGFLEGELTDSSGNLVAKASATAKIISLSV